ncbi:unnamed protein product [Onchocerca flexuosa]|uniref:Uncharacterized protein n=1 Tax=Onchocerca flexuosa TaxID=387005 RepID=A0A183I250_9BILA|nr:unnamed protein product [Onchocerca flexuosa]
MSTSDLSISDAGPLTFSSSQIKCLDACWLNADAHHIASCTVSIPGNAITPEMHRSKMPAGMHIRLNRHHTWSHLRLTSLCFPTISSHSLSPYLTLTVEDLFG